MIGDFFYFTHPLLQNTHISLSILHIYSIMYSFFYNFLLFSPSLPFSLTDPSLPMIPPHPATIITTQLASSRKTNPLNPKLNQSQIHSIPNPFIIHSTWNPLTIWWFDQRGLMIGKAFIWWFDRHGLMIGDWHGLMIYRRQVKDDQRQWRMIWSNEERESEVRCIWPTNNERE